MSVRPTQGVFQGARTLPPAARPRADCSSCDTPGRVRLLASRAIRVSGEAPLSVMLSVRAGGAGCPQSGMPPREPFLDDLASVAGEIDSPVLLIGSPAGANVAPTAQLLEPYAR